MIDGPADVAAEVPVGIGWFVAGERIARIPRRVGIVEVYRAVEVIRARLGENFDAPEPKLVELGREGVLVDADLSNGFLGRQLAAAETVDIDRAAVGTGARS